ncbi:cytochrome C oxidase subunit I [Streptomyces sp. NPDC006992]|uniref:cytochrome C oxidase subunit I n=1 Tax=Streptomyces sp. NPDC006992 TaxID=3155601 RepID=UPI0033CBA589
MGTGKSPEGEVGDGVRRIEGYLLWQRHLSDARARAEHALAPLDWLTGAEREDVVRRVADALADSSRAALRETAQRAVSLRREYEDRYAVLRRRVMGWAFCGLAVVSFVDGLLLMMR